MSSDALLKQHELIINGKKRRYWLQRPSARLAEIIPAPEKLPLVFVLHGSLMSSKQMMHFSEFRQMAETHHCLVAYPDMSYFWKWDVPEGFANKDVLFIEQLIAHLLKSGEVDPERIYATGFSSGADILHLLACNHNLSSQIAAFAPVCSNLDREWANLCEHQLPTSIMMINGTHDPFNKWDGDKKRWMSVTETFSYWQTHNKIASSSKEILLPKSANIVKNTPTKAHILQSFDPETGSEVSLVTIEGGGHTWPANRPDKWFARLLLGQTHKEKVTESLIWDFFDRHRRKSPRQTSVLQ